MVHELLLIGKQNAKSARTLRAQLHLKAPRDLSRQIERERRQGFPICASSDANNFGYYLAANKSEMQNYCNRLRHRAGEIFKTRAACIKSIENLAE